MHPKSLAHATTGAATPQTISQRRNKQPAGHNPRNLSQRRNKQPAAGHNPRHLSQRRNKQPTKHPAAPRGAATHSNNTRLESLIGMKGIAHNDQHQLYTNHADMTHTSLRPSLTAAQAQPLSQPWTLLAADASTQHQPFNIPCFPSLSPHTHHHRTTLALFVLYTTSITIQSHHRTQLRDTRTPPRASVRLLYRHPSAPPQPCIGSTPQAWS
jgi:hypothetical protein